VRVCHVKSAVFDDPNLVSTAGLVPVMALAQRAGLAGLVEAHVSVPGPAGAHAGVKVAAVVAGMVAGADSFEDLAVLRHGAMGRLLAEAPAPTTLGTHLRAYRFGHVRQLDAVATRVLAALATCTPVLTGIEQVAWIDVDDTIKADARLPPAGRGLRVLESEGFERPARGALDPAGRTGGRRGPVA